MAHITNYAHGRVWQGGARRCEAGLGKDNRGFAPALYSIFTNLSHIILRQGPGGAGLGAARQGKARSAGASLLLYIQFSQIILQAVLGTARPGTAWQRNARQGQQGQSPCFIFNLHKSITNYTRRGLVWHGNVRRCMVRQGSAWQGHRASKPCALCVNK